MTEANDPAAAGQLWHIVELFTALGFTDLALIKATAAQILAIDYLPDLRTLTSGQAAKLTDELLQAKARGTISRD